jgi:hypothetical protein
MLFTWKLLGISETISPPSHLPVWVPLKIKGIESIPNINENSDFAWSIHWHSKLWCWPHPFLGCSDSSLRFIKDIKRSRFPTHRRFSRSRLSIAIRCAIFLCKRSPVPSLYLHVQNDSNGLPLLPAIPNHAIFHFTITLLASSVTGPDCDVPLQ